MGFGSKNIGVKVPSTAILEICHSQNTLHFMMNIIHDAARCCSSVLPSGKKNKRTALRKLALGIFFSYYASGVKNKNKKTPHYIPVPLARKPPEKASVPHNAFFILKDF